MESVFFFNTFYYAQKNDMHILMIERMTHKDLCLK